MRGCQFTTAPQANRTDSKSKAPEVGPSRAFKEQEEGSVVGGEGNKGTPLPTSLHSTDELTEAERQEAS